MVTPRRTTLRRVFGERGILEPLYGPSLGCWEVQTMGRGATTDSVWHGGLWWRRFEAHLVRRSSTDRAVVEALRTSAHRCMARTGSEAIRM